MIIEKVAKKNLFRRKIYYYNNAREAFYNYLKSLNLNISDTILLPSYIGWSSKEGSGIFDPISELNLKFSFYKMDRNLNVNIHDVERILNIDHSIKVLLIVHYFGFPEPNTDKLVELAKAKGIKIIEDEAHAYFTDIIGGMCGRFGDASFFSIHKLFPTLNGGALVLNNLGHNEYFKNISYEYIPIFQEFDVKKISEIRYRNAKIIYNVLANYPEYFELIKPLTDGIFPQTVPIIVKNGTRDRLYFKLNDLGYGVVSLYHELISQIEEKYFPDSYFISRQILNLPVHQDIIESQMHIFLSIIIKEVQITNND